MLLLVGCPAQAADGPPAGAAADSNAVRQEFLAAMQRVRQRAAEPADSSALISDPIYSYLLVARLRRELQLKPSPELDATIDTFLQDHPGEPVIRDLRHDWLVSLAVRERWDWVLPRTVDVTDPVLVCDRLMARLSSGENASLAPDALALWMKPARQPHECDRVFKWLHDQDAITPAAAQARAHAALASDSLHLARDFVADVPSPQPAGLQQWLRLMETPRPALNDFATHPDVAIEPQALLAGFTRLSRADSVAALTLLPLLLSRPDTTPDLAGKLQRAAALGAAYDHNPAAVAAFRALPKSAIDNDVFEWRLRAALWLQDFKTVLAWSDELPDALKSQPRWRYWRARATEATLGIAAAQPLFSDIAGMRDYYAYLAADRVHRPYDLNVHPTPDDAAAQTTLASAPGLIRAHELFQCELFDDAAVEWNVVLADAQTAARVQAAHLAFHWGWYTQAIVTLAQANQWDDLSLRYPTPYGSEVEQASVATRLPADWILSVMRQESLFRKDATSRADARGLMQTLPSTATAVARRWHLPSPTHDALFDPATAIPIGAAYLRELNDRYPGQLALTLAAYNAGPLPLVRWAPPKTLDADIWIENIPYNETRGYVQRILEHIVAYAQVRQAPLPHLTALLPAVDPGTGAVAVSRLQPPGDPLPPRW